MTDDPSATADVNERVESEWVDETTPFERVRSVTKRLYDPTPVQEIADRARTTEKTARKHLRQLAESGFVEETASPERNGTLYRRSPESLVLEQAHDMLEEMDSVALVSHISEMQAELRDYRAEADAESPEDAVLQEAELDAATLTEWQTTRRNLGFARVALALSEAEDAVRKEPVV